MKSTTDYTALAVVLAYFMVVGACALGWIANVVKIFWTIGEPITGMFVLRCVGVVLAPIGVVLGYL